MGRPPFLRPVRARFVALALACLPAGHAALAQAPEAGTIRGPGRVREDGSLSVSGAIVHLAGVYMPRPSGCGTTSRATGCRPRAVSALSNKVSGFVHCAISGRQQDGSLEGFCSVPARSIRDPRTDLGAWLVEQGLALAGLGAPPEYLALQRLAEVQGRGLWAVSSSSSRRRHY